LLVSCFFFFKVLIIQTLKELNSKDVYIKENINLFQKLKKVFCINKIEEIDKVDTKKLDKYRFFFDIEVLLTF